MSIEFTLDGVTFKGKPLDPEKSLDGFAMLAPILGPVLDGIDPEAEDTLGQVAGALKGLLLGFRDLPKFRPLLLPQYTASIVDERAEGRPVRDLPLSVCGKQLFTGRPALQTAWLIAAIHAEYGDFLTSNGLNTLRDLANRLGFQITLPGIGQSGD